MTEKMEAILNDLAQGGYMGVREKETRHEAGIEYNMCLMLKRKNLLQYRLYVLCRKIRTSSTYMFMSYERLVEIYPLLKKVIILYPFVWLYQVFAYPISKMNSEIMQKKVRSDSMEVDQGEKKRMRLFKDLEML